MNEWIYNLWAFYLLCNLTELFSWRARQTRRRCHSLNTFWTALFYRLDSLLSNYHVITNFTYTLYYLCTYLLSKYFSDPTRRTTKPKRFASKTCYFERQANWATFGWVSKTNAIDRCFTKTKGTYEIRFEKRKYTLI